MENNSALVKGAQKYQRVLREYCDLSIQETLTDTDADRLAEILVEAQCEPLLGFLIDEADHILAHEYGLIDAEFIRNQQHQLSQLVDKSWIDISVKAPLEEAQKHLKSKGLYSGPINGVNDPETRKAFQVFRKSLQLALQNQGLYRGPIDGACNPEFQKVLENLKSTGNLDDETAKVAELGNLACNVI